MREWRPDDVGPDGRPTPPARWPARALWALACLVSGCFAAIESPPCGADAPCPAGRTCAAGACVVADARDAADGTPPVADALGPRDGSPGDAADATRPADAAPDLDRGLAPDVAASDGSAPEAAAPDAAVVPDATPPLPDARVSDATVDMALAVDAARDASARDAAVADMAPPDAAIPDAAPPDATVDLDMAAPDAAVPDSAVPDAAVPDAALVACEVTNDHNNDDGIILPPSLNVTADMPGEWHRPEAAWSGSELAVTWSGIGDGEAVERAWVAVFDRTGRRLRGPFELRGVGAGGAACPGPQREVAPVWAGDRFVVAWSGDCGSGAADIFLAEIPQDDGAAPVPRAWLRTPEDSRLPALAWNATLQQLAVLFADQGGASPSTLLLARAHADGTPIDRPQPVYQGPTVTSTAAAAHDDGFAVAHLGRLDPPMVDGDGVLDTLQGHVLAYRPAQGGELQAFQGYVATALSNVRLVDIDDGYGTVLGFGRSNETPFAHLPFLVTHHYRQGEEANGYAYFDCGDTTTDIPSVGIARTAGHVAVAWVRTPGNERAGRPRDASLIYVTRATPAGVPYGPDNACAYGRLLRKEIRGYDSVLADVSLTSLGGEDLALVYFDPAFGGSVVLALDTFADCDVYPPVP
jgi:hypothetical protein